MAIGGSPQIATAAIGLIPVISGVQGNIASQLAGSQVMSGADKAGRSIGSRLGSTITSTLKTGLKIGGVVTGAIAGLTLKGGINRALGIEDARAMMAGLGHDTGTVEKIMGNALASVEGTAFGLDAAATTAAGAVAAGIKPGEQLEKTLSTVANVAAGAKAPLDEIGNIFNTVASVGAAYTGDINMIAQRGIPIWQSLSDTLGVSQDQVKKMARDGKIDFATFEAAAADAAGGVATAMGDTTRGSIANMLTSFSKLGADVVTRFMPMVKAGASGIQSTVQAITAKLGPVLDHLFGSFTPAATAGVEGFFENLVSWIEGFDPQRVIDFLDRVGEVGRNVFGEMRDGITAFGAAWEYNDGEVTSSGFPGFMERAGYFVRQLWDSVKELDFSSFSAFTESISGSLSNVSGAGALTGVGGALSDIAAASPTLLAAALEGVGNAMGFLAEHSDTIVKMLPWLIAGFAAYRVGSQGVTAAVTAQRAAYIASLPMRIAANTALAIANGLELLNTVITNRNTTATSMNAAATTRSTLAQRAHNVATKLGTIATTIAAGAQRAFGAALRFAMGPIGWIITGVTLLVGALVLFFTKTEVGQKLWAKIWGWIKDAAAAVVDWFTGTALPYLQAAWDGIAAGALWLYENAILPAWAGIKTAIAAVGDWITGTLWPAMQSAWTAIGAAAQWLYTSVILPVWNGIKLAIAIAVTAILVYIDLLKWYWNTVLAPVAIWLYESVIKPVWNAIKTAIAAVVDWFVNTGWPVLKKAWDAVASAAVWLYENALKPAWNAIKSAINAVVAWFRDTAWPILSSVISWIATKFDQFKIGLGIIWGYIKNSVINPVISWFQNTAWPLIKYVIDLIIAGFVLWRDTIKAIWNFVKNSVINPVIAWFRDTAWPLIKNVIESIKTGFNVMRDGIKAAWDFVKNRAIQPVADWLTNTLKPKIDGVTDNIKKAFDSMKEGIKKAWDAVKDAARTPVKFVVEDVYNESLRSTFNGVADKLSLPAKWRLPVGKVGFATGGIMPGYTPGRDVHRFVSPTGGVLDLSGGEPILRPEAGRVLGSGWVHGINAAARTGGTDGVKSFLGGGHQAFAGGGIWGRIKGVGGDAWDWLTDQASAIAEAVSDPFGVLTKLAGKVTDLIPGGGMFREMAVGAGKNAGEMLGDWLRSQLSMSEVGTGTVPQAGASGTGWARAANAASALGLTMTSSTRRGARTAGSGSVSLHALGRARDYAGSASAMRAFFNMMDSSPYPTELLYSPMGGRNIHRGGRRYANTGATLRNHYNHVHLGYSKGGIYGSHMGGSPYLYDQGGEIPPGVRMVANKTRRPEKVLPPRESEALTSLANSGGGQHFHYSPQQVDLDHEIERRTRREFEAMAHAAQEVMGA